MSRYNNMSVATRQQHDQAHQNILEFWGLDSLFGALGDDLEPSTDCRNWGTGLMSDLETLAGVSKKQFRGALRVLKFHRDERVALEKRKADLKRLAEDAVGTKHSREKEAEPKTHVNGVSKRTKKLMPEDVKNAIMQWRDMTTRERSDACYHKGLWSDASIRKKLTNQPTYTSLGKRRRSNEHNDEEEEDDEEEHRIIHVIANTAKNKHKKRRTNGPQREQGRKKSTKNIKTRAASAITNRRSDRLQKIERRSYTNNGIRESEVVQPDYDVEMQDRDLDDMEQDNPAQHMNDTEQDPPTQQWNGSEQDVPAQDWNDFEQDIPTQHWDDIEQEVQRQHMNNSEEEVPIQHFNDIEREISNQDDMDVKPIQQAEEPVMLRSSHASLAATRLRDGCRVREPSHGDYLSEHEAGFTENAEAQASSSFLSALPTVEHAANQDDNEGSVSPQNVRHAFEDNAADLDLQASPGPPEVHRTIGRRLDSVGLPTFTPTRESTERREDSEPTPRFRRRVRWIDLPAPKMEPETPPRLQSEQPTVEPASAVPDLNPLDNGPTEDAVEAAIVPPPNRAVQVPLDNNPIEEDAEAAIVPLPTNAAQVQQITPAPSEQHSPPQSGNVHSAPRHPSPPTIPIKNRERAMKTAEHELRKAKADENVAKAEVKVCKAELDALEIALGLDDEVAQAEIKLAEAEKKVTEKRRGFLECRQKLSELREEMK